MAGPLDPTAPLPSAELSAPTALPPGYVSPLPTSLPPGYQPPSLPSEGPLGSLREFVQGTVDPLLSGLRDTAGNLFKSAVPLFSPPAIQAGQGPLGGKLLEGAVDMLNPLPRDTSDLMRDAAFLAIPGSGGARAALRIGAGTGGAVAGANLGGKSELTAAGTSLPGLLLGEGARGMTKNIGREARQSAEDVQNVTRTMNAAEPDLALPANVKGLYTKAFAPQGKGNIKDITTPRYQEMLDTVEQRMVDPDRTLLTLPDGQEANFRDAMDYIMRGSTASQRKGPLGEAPRSARQQAMETIQVRKGVIDALKNSPEPSEQALGGIVQEETKRFFIDMTARRLLRSPGVLNEETGLWNMRAAQEAFHKQLAKEMIPPDVYEAFQGAFYRGSKPPQMDVMGDAGKVTKILGGLAGMVMAPKHPGIGFQGGKNAAAGMSHPLSYVGETVGPSPLSQIIGAPISLGSAQSLKELLSGLQ